MARSSSPQPPRAPVLSLSLSLSLSLAFGCASPEGASPVSTAVVRVSAAAVTAPGAASLAASSGAAPSVASAPSKVAAPPRVPLARASELMFIGGPPAEACAAGDEAARTRCLVSRRFEEDPESQKRALALYDEVGDVVGLEREHQMEGGFRGTIHIVPELPIGQYGKHLGYLLEAQRSILAFTRAIEAEAKAPVRYRHAAIGWRFFRSVGRTTPSAYASGWEVAYNVSGSLHGSADAVRETIFHEVFHLNDGRHDDWSRRVLGPIADSIAAKCGQKTACLTPYAPGKTMVRGGTYYAFQANNGDIAHEYSAELATRYWSEQRAMLAGKPLAQKAFKCGPEENARAMRLLADEFFGGVDLVPACK